MIDERIVENYGIGNAALTNGYQRIQGRILGRNPLANTVVVIEYRNIHGIQTAHG